ncbi:hypothetical protein PYCCODRAFT_671967 [Trametes coccinea BRFM310]|uniref:F-box domain-containing protein n=1 Tax=Trametes coccinea (strain BRFM310) TaxID=1353009 RepID=A0A1Y2IHL0_TRAC3|nr:hypothetical protein PYCCODRAFT_671967 [Trametes coccinea BRFM310]
MPQTRARLRAQTRFTPDVTTQAIPGLQRTSAPILRLPPELHRLIIDELVSADSEVLLSWWASLATICKTLLPHVEAKLYFSAEFVTCKDAKIYLRSVAMPDRPHRALAVRSLSLVIKRAATIVHLFKNAFPKLVNLLVLTLVSDTVQLFDPLLTTPPHVLSLVVGGANYPPRFRDILSAQSHVRGLCIEFPAGDEQIPPFAGKDLLPNLHVLRLSAHIFPPTLFTYAYPLTSLTLVKPSHEDMSHALQLFGETLLVFVILKEVTPRCSPRCFWPTWLLRGVRLRKLRYLEVQQEWSWDLQRDMGDFDYPVVEAMTDPGLKEACPMLQTIVWGTEYLVTDSLYESVLGDGPAPIHQYVRMLFDVFPRLDRLAVYDRIDVDDDSRRRILGDIWTRANKDSDDPDYGLVDTPGWMDKALAAVEES